MDFPTSPANGYSFDYDKITYTYNAAKNAWTTKATPYVKGAEPFNYVLNPSFLSSQEYGDNSVTTSSGAPADNWHVQGSPAPFSTYASAYRHAATSPPNGSKYSLRLSAGTGIASAAATDYMSIYQYIEGQWLQTFFEGSAQAKGMVLRFWVKASHAGTYGGALRTQPATQRSFPFQYTIAAGQINTWVEQQIYILGDTAGVAANWPKDNTYTAILWFTFFAGSNWRAGPNAWGANTAIAPTGISAVWPAGATFEIADVGLYRDPNSAYLAPKWQAPEPILSQRQAMRYWYRSWYANGASNTTTLCGRAGMPHPVQMRIAPALAEVGAMSCQDGGLGAIASIAATGNNACYEANHTTGANLTVGRACHQAGAYASAYIAASAR